jgi:hypothetical protein
MGAHSAKHLITRYAGAVSHAVRKTACSVIANAGHRRLLISPTKTIHCKVLRNVGSSLKGKLSTQLTDEVKHRIINDAINLH